MNYMLFVVFFKLAGDHLDLHVLTHSFPTRRSSDLLGFYTDVKTRPLIIDELRQAVREKVILLNDATTIDEMITFVADPKSGKIEAEVGCHDDCVMALAIANHIHDGCWDLVPVTDDMFIEMI